MLRRDQADREKSRRCNAQLLHMCCPFTFWPASSNRLFDFLQKITDPGVQFLSAKLNFVDLAGPECLKQTEATVQTQWKGIAKNLGLVRAKIE